MKVLIADDVHPLLMQVLENEKLAYDYQPDIQRNELKQCLNDYQILVIRSKTMVDEDLLQSNRSLKFIGRAGSGMDTIDIDACIKRNILCENAGEANAQAVAEHSLSLLLSLLHNTARADREVRDMIWQREENRGVELAGKTIGIIGYGNTGKAFARLLKSFSCKVLVYDKYLENYSDDFAQESNMQMIFNQADIISFHIPLTAETKYLANVNFFQSFANPFWLLNLSRGKVLRTKDLIEGIKSGKIKGAALDVLENEDLKSLNAIEFDEFNELLRLPNVLLNPHIGGWTIESYRRISEVIARKIVQFTRIQSQ